MGRIDRPMRKACNPPPPAFRPWILAAVTALWIARPMFPSEAAASRGDGLIAVMFWIVLGVAWLLAVIGQREIRFRFGWVDGALGVFVVFHTIAALWAVAHASPRPAVNMLWEWVGLAIAFWLTRQVLLGCRETRAMVAVMVGLAVAMAAYGLYQYFYELPLTRAEYRLAPDHYLAENGLWFSPGSPERALFENRLESVEPLATFALTNSLAGFLAPWLVVLAGIAAMGLPERGRWAAIGGLIASATIIGASLLLTKSRSACLATLFGWLCVAIAWKRMAVRLPWKPIAAVAGVLLVLAVTAVAIGGLDRQVITEATKSLGYRGQYWRATLAMIADHPLVGCGPGNFQEAYQAYKLPEASEDISDPHNFLLEIWGTAGTPALLGFVGIFAALALLLAQRGRASRGLVSPRPDSSLGETRPHGSDQRSTPSLVDSSAQADDHACFVLGGAVAGLVAAFPLGSVSAAPPTMFLVAFVVLWATGAVGLLWSWIDRGQLPRAAVYAGLVALLINFLAAGGIGFPAVSGCLWLLLAIAISDPQRTLGFLLPRGVAVVLLPLTICIGYCCYRTGYEPVIQCQAALALAQREPSQAEKHLLEAAKADPLASEPLAELVSLVSADWNTHPVEATLPKFERYADSLSKTAPNSAALWRLVSKSYLRAFEKTGDRKFLDKALVALRHSRGLYPNDATGRAELAIALRAAGDEAGFILERDKALWLDQATPHLDRKLDKILSIELHKSLGRSNSRSQ